MSFRHTSISYRTRLLHELVHAAINPRLMDIAPFWPAWCRVLTRSYDTASRRCNYQFAVRGFNQDPTRDYSERRVLFIFRLGIPIDTRCL